MWEKGENQRLPCFSENSGPRGVALSQDVSEMSMGGGKDGYNLTLCP